MTAFFDSLLGFDLAVFEWVQSIQSHFLTAIMTTVTTLGDEGIIFIVLGLVLLCTKKYRKAGVSILVALVVMLLLNNIVLKELIARPRPFNLDPETYDWWYEVYKYPYFKIHQPSSFSFPSGHTSSAFAAAIALLCHDRKLGIPTTIFAAIMGFSRIYVEVHYCTDVIGGAIVGIIYALIGVLIAKLVYPYVDKAFNAVAKKLKKKEA
jgi:undecaprenyl-diphosphatase